ncbi:polysaccharide deacetylase family protein [Arthrobacter sp. efr-133-TYG-118]|uniref:polysaccharide deacetylase family protein n=1 Tax=Arthrobacter sp. efr-133-TYG-118 TaxID=3040279 RepID=UPI00254E9F13|nr:polysaccharide deacetylase family protein [Arthrobacter sp. efr-133-TYG-118]
MSPREEGTASGPVRASRKRVGLWAASWVSVLLLLTGATSLINGSQAPVSGSGTSTPTPSVAPLSSVSLTFDAGRASQMEAARILKDHGLRATYFIDSGFVGAPDYMTTDNLHSLAADQNEIGGHTVTLADVTSVEPDEASRQICNDRVNLTDWGFKVTSFAYPFASSTPKSEELVAGCGYNSARGLGEISTPVDCVGCAAAETVRPADLFRTRATSEIGSKWTLANLEATVEQAEKAGGWLQLTFYDIDNSGSPRSISPALFEQFAAWLAAKTQPGTMAVRTVHDVIGGVAKPVVNGPVAVPAAAGQNALRNPGLETAGKYGLPQCWQVSSYGKNAAVLSTLTPGRSGAVARRLDVTEYSSGDAKLLPVLDLGACAPSVSTGHSYSLRAWYQSTAKTQFEVYYRNKLGTWTYWTASPWFAANTNYEQAIWETPPVPVGAEAISFGLNLFSDGQLATDDYEMYDTVGAPSP